MASTKVEFVRDLEATAVPLTDLDDKATILRRASLGVYHDFETDLPFPKRALVADLERIGLRDLADKVRNGDYDEPPSWRK